MYKDERKTIHDLMKENSYLKQELLKSLDEKEELLVICKTLMNDYQKIETRYTNLRNSKLGRITTWYWRKGSVKNGKK